MGLLDEFAGTLGPTARIAAERAARSLFAGRGDRTIVHMTELELAAAIAATIQGLMELAQDAKALRDMPMPTSGRPL